MTLTGRNGTSAPRQTSAARSATPVLQLDHVGSTSVPGLAAKPRIDINLVVADTTDEDAYVPKLEPSATSCACASPTGTSTGCCADRPACEPARLQPGCEEVDQMLVLRDWLRTHDDDRELYERTKRELAAQRVEVRPELRRREDRGNPADPRARQGRLMLTGHATVLLVEDVAQSRSSTTATARLRHLALREDPGHYGYARARRLPRPLRELPRREGASEREVVPPDMFDIYFLGRKKSGCVHAEVVERGADVDSEASRPGLWAAGHPRPRPARLHPRVRESARLTRLEARRVASTRQCSQTHPPPER